MSQNTPSIIYVILLMICQYHLISGTPQLYTLENIKGYLTDMLKGKLNLNEDMREYFKSKQCRDFTIDFNGQYDLSLEEVPHNVNKTICPATVNANINLCRWPPVILESSCKNQHHQISVWDVKVKATCVQVTKPMIVLQSYIRLGQLTFPQYARHPQQSGCFFSDLVKIP